MAPDPDHARTARDDHGRTDEAARRTWIRTQQTALWRYLRLLGARPHEVEDLMQDAFVALFSRYDHEAPSAQVRLLRTIARNELLQLRRGDRDALPWTEAVEAWTAQNPTAFDDEHAAAVAACLDELTPRVRQGLLLRHVEGQPVDHVARQLGLRRSGTLTLLQRGRDLLRACLSRRGHAPRATAQRPHDPSSLTSS